MILKRRIEKLESKIFNTPLKIIILKCGEQLDKKDKASIIIEFSEKVDVDQI